jgi:cell division protein FtsN
MSDDHRRRGPSDPEDDSPYPWMRGELEEEVSQPFKPWMIAVALASMLIFIIAVWYAWTEGKTVNDGPPPIIQADNSPVKEAPKDPGGMVVPHQDNEVFNALDGGKETAEELLPPPEEPVDRPAPVAPPAPEPQQQTADAAPAPQQPEPQRQAPAPTPPAPVPAPAPAQAQTQTKPPAPAPTATPAPAPASSGLYVIQLAALRSQAAAEQSWNSLVKTHAALLGQLSLDVEPVTISGQGMFYRVRAAGFDSEAAAKARCDQLKAAGQACLVKKR